MRPEPAVLDFAWRTLRLLNTFRLLYSALLFAMLAFPSEPPLVGGEYPQIFLATVAAAFVWAAINDFAITRRRPSIEAQSTMQAILDVTIIGILTWTSGGLGSGVENLLVITVSALAVVSSRVRAMAFASMAALAVLAIHGLSALQGDLPIGDTTQAGLFGGLLMLLALAASPLARRITESEALAHQRGIDLENLNQLNEYIVQNLRESIVVLDGGNHVKLFNEAAAKYLGIDSDRRGPLLDEASPRLALAVREWRLHGNSAPSGAFPSADGTTHILPSFAPIGRPRSGALLVFLEDTSIRSEKAQQAKLAALGRLSASIAHEIRNPVGALSHAAQLLAESENLEGTQRRLLTMIENNANRVSNIVENVLQLSRRGQIEPKRLELGTWVRQFVDEFTGSGALPETAVELEMPEVPIEVRMDENHLYQVLTNLCENAVRYGTPMGGKPGIEIAMGRRGGSDRPYLEVRDRGPGIPDEMTERVFEPFFRAGTGATQSEGSGLGLFISRELCEVNRAALGYEARDGGGSIFRITFADPQRWEA